MFNLQFELENRVLELRNWSMCKKNWILLLEIKKDIVNKLKDDGIFKVDKLLNDKEFSELEKILSKYKSDDYSLIGTTFKSYDSFIYRSRGRYLLKQLKSFKIKKFFESLKIIKISKKLKFKEIADSFFGQKTKLTNIDVYYSKKSGKNILDWHTDQSYSGKLNVTNFENPLHSALKFFVYMTPVDSNNGCLGYIPNSSKFTNHLKQNIYDKKIKYSPYWLLKDFRNIISETNYRKFLEKKISSIEIEKFLNETNFIEKEPYDTNKFDYKLNKGGAIIFDESGIHRASKPQITDRLSLRYTYKIESAPD